MLNVCPNCHYVGEDKHDFSPYNVLYGLFTTIFGLFSLLGTYILDLHLIYKIVSFLLLLAGLILIRGYFKGRVCPNCNYKDMTPMDQPEAMKLIKQYDLQVGVNKFPKQEQESDQTKAPIT